MSTQTSTEESIKEEAKKPTVVKSQGLISSFSADGSVAVHEIVNKEYTPPERTERGNQVWLDFSVKNLFGNSRASSSRPVGVSIYNSESDEYTNLTLLDENEEPLAFVNTRGFLGNEKILAFGNELRSQITVGMSQRSKTVSGTEIQVVIPDNKVDALVLSNSVLITPELLAGLVLAYNMAHGTDLSLNLND